MKDGLQQVEGSQQVSDPSVIENYLYMELEKKILLSGKTKQNKTHQWVRGMSTPQHVSTVPGGMGG